LAGEKIEGWRKDQTGRSKVEYFELDDDLRWYCFFDILFDIIMHAGHGDNVRRYKSNVKDKLCNNRQNFAEKRIFFLYFVKIN